MVDFIPYGKQYINAEDIDAVKNVLTSSYLTQGNIVEQFETELQNYVGSNFATVVNSATSALHLACLALGVYDGSLVWTSPITFVASSNAPLMCGASVDFVDIDETLCMCPNKLQEKLVGAVEAGTIPDVIIVVHMCGQSADMERIRNITAPYGIKIIEDMSVKNTKGKNVPLSASKNSSSSGLLLSVLGAGGAQLFFKRAAKPMYPKTNGTNV